MTYKTIEITQKEKITTIWLNRPEIHNAFDEVMITELLDAFEKIKTNEETKIVILRGRGKTFCAGADLNWMKNVANYQFNQNYEESLNLSKCFHAIYTCPKPTIAVVQGAAIGGANGLMAACDFAYCTNDTVFSLSEVKIGIVPACISPYVLKRVGEYRAKHLMLTGLRFKGKKAEEYKLVNKSLPQAEIEDKINSITGMLLTSGPNAVTHCKNLINNIVNHLSEEEAITYTARIIAEIRASEEGQEGMDAFLNKRKPKWVD